MRRVDGFLATAAAAFVAGSTALVDFGRLGAGISLLAVSTIAALFGVLHATDAPPVAAEADEEDPADGVS